MGAIAEKPATKPMRLLEADHQPVRFIAELEGRPGYEVIHTAIEEYIHNHRARLGETFARAQRAINSGDLGALTKILAASADAQTTEAAGYISSLE